MSKLAWGIIGAGRIAGIFANGVQQSKYGELLAVGSRSQEKADKFGDEHNIPRRYASYEALLADPDVQAVYIATPHPVHPEWAIKAAEAGKHILCEKPISLNYPQAMAVIDAARRNDVYLMEAFMYRAHPHIAKVVELIREKAIGDVRMIEASFSYNAGFNPDSRVFNNALGGGGILDVGCYPVSFARLVAAAALGREVADPIEIKALGHLCETGVDAWTAAILKFPGDIIAQVSTGVQVGQENTARIYGSAGNIYLPKPWFGQDITKTIIVNRQGQEPEEIELEAYANPYGLEADILAQNIEKRQAPFPAMSWADTLGNMQTLDAWRGQIGQMYDIEKPGADFPTVDGRPLAVRSGSKMKYGQLPGLDKPVSREIMGIMNAPAPNVLSYASVMFDEYFRSGGNTFDTAYIYGGGQVDRTLGQWIKNRGIREQVCILGKGAHTPCCNPEDLTRQLFESLERLQTDYIDIYMMHRDNPEVPVGEFVDVLNEHKNAGRIRVFGGSNWSYQRFEEANAYAKSKGLTGFVGINNNFSLARMVEAPWAGCIASADAESRAWFEKTQTPLLAWSSLAKGFFSTENLDNLAENDLIRSWYADDNIERLARARELAAKKGVLPVQIALAWVLNQPFPTFALVGPRSPQEMQTSINALDIELTPEELKWLNLEG